MSSTIPARIYEVEATKIASDFEVNSARCSVFGKETTTVDIYVYMQGQRRGPYEKVQLEAMWKRGKVPADTLYWHDGMSKWAVISDLIAGKIIASSLPEDAANAETTTSPASCKIGRLSEDNRPQPRHAI